MTVTKHAFRRASFASSRDEVSRLMPATVMGI